MDDNVMVRETMRRQLIVLGYEVAVAAEGREAVEAYLQARGDGRPFDVVVLGMLVAGGWGGEQTLADLTRLDPGAKVMIWSDWLHPRLNAQVRLRGGCVLGKPHSLGELQLKLAALLPA